MSIEDFVSHFPGGRWRGDEYVVCCPGHEDKKPSLGISRGKHGGIVMCCQAGCANHDILAKVGLDLTALAPPRSNGAPPTGETVYVYHDEEGNPLFEVVRTADKHFWQLLPGAHKGGVGEVRRVLFELPRLLKTASGDTIFIVEGEKDCWRLWKLGLPGTTNAQGAGKWRQEYTDWLKEHLPDRKFVILPDNDPPGIKHAEEVEQSLKRAGLAVRAVLLPGLPAKGDVSDWLAGGKTKEELLAAIRPPPHPLLSVLLSRAALRDQSPPVWQIDGLFQEASIIEIYGESNHGKSLVGVDIGLSLVRAGYWCGREIKKPGAVVYVNADGGAGFSDRLRWWERANGDEAIFDFWTYPMELLLHDPVQVRWFIEGLRELEDAPALVFFDTLSQCIPGANENQQEQMSIVVSGLNAIKREFGATCCLLHHVGKDGMNRGSTVIPGAADTIIRCAQVTTDLIELRCEKQRNGRKFDPLYFEMHRHGLDEGVYLVQGEAPGLHSVREAKEQEVLTIFREAGRWMGRDEARRHLPHLSPAALFRHIRALLEQGHLIEEEAGEGEGRRAKVYLYRPSVDRLPW